MKWPIGWEKQIHWMLWPGILGLVLLGQQSWVPGFFHDGNLYSALAKNAAELGTYFNPTASGNYYPGDFYQHPPLYFIIYGFFIKVFGSSWSALRLFPVLVTLANLFLVMMLLRRWPIQAFAAGVLYLAIPAVLKNGRFPSLDFALSWCLMLALYAYQRWMVGGKGAKYGWMMAISLGLGFWFKGASALLLVAFLGFHSLVYASINKNWRFFFHTICAVVASFGIFSLWFLWVKYKFEVNLWHEYVVKQFLWSAVKGRGNSVNWWDHFFYLYMWATRIPFHLGLLLLATLRFWRKKEWNSIASISLQFVLFSFVLLSIPSHQYSHYLIALYPALAIGLGVYLSDVIDVVWWPKIRQGVKGLAVVAAIILLVFPLTTKVRRHPALHHLWELSPRASKWIVIDEAYSLYAVTNLLALKDRREAEFINLHQLKSFLCDGCLFLAPINYADKIEQVAEGMLVPLARYPKEYLEVYRLQQNAKEFLEF